MESIPEIEMSDSQESFLSDDSDYLERRLEKDKNKKQQLMAQRLRGRMAKTQRLRKDSDTNYDNIIINNDDDDLTSFWDQIKNKNPEEVRNVSSNLFIKNTGKGGRTRKLRKVKKRTTRKVRHIKKSRKTKKQKK